MGNQIIEGAKTHLELRSPMNGEQCGIFFMSEFNGFDEIAGGFTSKVDFRKSSKILSMLSMLQKAPNRRSPNPYNYKLKWPVSLRRLKSWSKCSDVWKWKFTVSWKGWSSEYALFPQRQSYFTYGDVESSVVKIVACAGAMHEIKSRRYSDCSKMCL